MIIEFEDDMGDILLELEDVLKDSGAHFAAGLVYSAYLRFGEDDPMPPEQVTVRAKPDDEENEVTPGSSD